MAVERTGLQVFITHDVRAAASGEAALGSARGAGDHLFVAMGTGIGAAVVIGGKPYTGTHATAGEMGHMTIDPEGPECGCGAPWTPRGVRVGRGHAPPVRGRHRR